MSTEEDINIFWTLANNDIDRIYQYHQPHFFNFYKKQISKIHKLTRFESQNFIQTKYYTDFVSRLDELKLLNESTFISSFNLDNNGKFIYCMDGTISYGMDDDILVISAVIVLPSKQRQGIFTNFLQYVIMFEDINSIVITDISDSMKNLISKVILTGRSFKYTEPDAIWNR